MTILSIIGIQFLTRHRTKKQCKWNIPRGNSPLVNWKWDLHPAASHINTCSSEKMASFWNKEPPALPRHAPRHEVKAGLKK